jgi:hypothetical protein
MYFTNPNFVTTRQAYVFFTTARIIISLLKQVTGSNISNYVECCVVTVIVAAASILFALLYSEALDLQGTGIGICLFGSLVKHSAMKTCMEWRYGSALLSHDVT